MSDRVLLWSGGFDSTFRLIDQISSGQSVLAVYIEQSATWQKQVRERKAREIILSRLPEELRRRVALEEWGDSSEFWQHRFFEATLRAASLEGIREQDVAMIAAGLVAPGIEAGYVATDSLAADRQRLDLVDGFGVKFPLLARTKAELLADADRRGFGDLIRLTWSCEGENHEAVTGPCGICEPCKARILPQRVLAPCPTSELPAHRGDDISSEWRQLQ